MKICVYFRNSVPSMCSEKYQHFRSIAINASCNMDREKNSRRTMLKSQVTTSTNLHLSKSLYGDQSAAKKPSVSRRYKHTSRGYEDKSKSRRKRTRYDSPSETASRSKYHRNKRARNDRSRSPVVNERYQKHVNQRYEKESYFQKREYKRQDDYSFKSKTLTEQIEEFLQIEDHHIENVFRNSKGGINYVKWCPKYINPKIKGRVIGGKALLHHRCRGCHEIVLHLLGRYGSSDRKCLKCKASEHDWDKDKVPEWYYHHRGCYHCR